jgi:hypothetical protein
MESDFVSNGATKSQKKEQLDSPPNKPLVPTALRAAAHRQVVGRAGVGP